MAPLTIDAPGAYPATPSNEEPIMQHTQPSRHDFAKETPRGGPYFHDFGTQGDNSSSSSERAKPGVMTGAFSRVGTRDSALSQNTNYTFDNTSTAELLRGNNPPQFDNKKPADKPTNVIAPANTPAAPTNPGSNVNNTAHAKGYGHQDRNQVQGSLRGKSSTKNPEPYWGSIPFGVGVYNGVTGHGSDASTTPQESLDQPDSSTTTSSGVYNGVVGHGSKESPSPRLSQYDQDIETDDSSHQQRAFPLANNANTKAGAKSNGVDAHNKRDSHFKEALAGAGGVAAGGYAAHEYSRKDSTNEVQAANEKRKDANPSETGQTKPHAVVSPRSHQGKEAIPATTRSEKDQTPEGQQAPDTEAGTAKGGSNPGYYGAAATAAGAGVYGAHKYAGRDGAREPRSAPEDKDKDEVASSAAPRGGLGGAAPNGPPVAASHATATREQPRHDVLSDDRSPDQPFESSLSRTPQNGVQNGGRNVLSGHVASRDTERFSSDSSRGGMYNVLASGTPSGINLAHAHVSRKHHR